MAEEQLKLFETCSVIQRRFDRTFFRSLPDCAGVYLMCDAESHVIYVGKAKNLRQRIGSYRYADERCSRKTARLVARIASIRWQECASEEAALLEENRLLRELRPRFNRMNTWPKAAQFIRLVVDSTFVQMSLTTEADGQCYGAFKGVSRDVFGALLRLLWAIGDPYAGLPRSLLLHRPAAAHEFPLSQAERWLGPLRTSLRGECDELASRFAAAAANEQCPFYSAFRQADLLAVEQFLRIGPQRNQRLRLQFGAGELIGQAELDDLIVRDRQAQRVAASSKPA
jgi:excinuclease UvrABC nuclease subunit